MKNPIGYFTNTFKSMVYNYIDSFREIHNLANRKPSACTSDGIFYNWLEVDGSKIPSTKTIDTPLLQVYIIKYLKKKLTKWDYIKCGGSIIRLFQWDCE